MKRGPGEGPQQHDNPVEAGWQIVNISQAADLLGFAEWAFGPRGFPKLLILAYGDFSYDGRYRGSQVLFCRNSLPITDTEDDFILRSELESGRPFRIMCRSDDHLWGRIGNGSEVLSACPVGDLLERTDGDD